MAVAARLVSISSARSNGISKPLSNDSFIALSRCAGYDASCLAWARASSSRVSLGHNPVYKANFQRFGGVHTLVAKQRL